MSASTLAHLIPEEKFQQASTDAWDLPCCSASWALEKTQMTRGDIKRVLNMFQKKLVRIPGPRGPATISICKCPITLQIVEIRIWWTLFSKRACDQGTREWCWWYWSGLECPYPHNATPPPLSEIRPYYCWWFRNPANHLGCTKLWIYGINNLSTGAGSLPSTVPPQ